MSVEHMTNKKFKNEVLSETLEELNKQIIKLDYSTIETEELKR